eukprot:6439892-Lingulodinium_polyedra.AAC.2
MNALVRGDTCSNGDVLICLLWAFFLGGVTGQATSAASSSRDSKALATDVARLASPPALPVRPALASETDAMTALVAMAVAETAGDT